MTSETPLAAYRFRRDQASLWQMLREGIGDVAAVIPTTILDDFAVQLPGTGAPLVVSSPELAREVLNDRADHFTRDRFVRRLFRRSWGRGLAAAEGDDWRRQRRAAAPFFTPRAVNGHLGAFAAATDAALDQVKDGPVDLVRLAGGIVSRIVLSLLVDAQGRADPDAAAADVPAYIRRITGFTATDLLPLPERLIDRIQRIDSDPAVVRLRDLGSRLAQAREGAALHDMIALLDGVGPIEDNIRGLFPAAMDTTVAGLGWAFHVMAQRPAWQDQVAAEGRAMGNAFDLGRLRVTRRVVSEVLRLYPPAPQLARCAALDMELAGHRVRRGQTVIVSIYAMHRHRRLWTAPDSFDPDRWVEGAAAADAYIPFGTGPRMCVAAHFAQTEIAVALARTLARISLGAATPDPEVSLRVTTHAAGPLGAAAQRRR